MPKRIQLSRNKGWSKPEGAIVVSRPSKWGNPFRVQRCEKSGLWLVVNTGTRELFLSTHSKEVAIQHAVNAHAMHIDDESVEAIRAELSGRDLACWCKLGTPCHADTLLELANQ